MASLSCGRPCSRLTTSLRRWHSEQGGCAESVAAIPIDEPGVDEGAAMKAAGDPAAS